MARPGVTLHDVEEAVGLLERDGQSPTQLAVRRALGDRGSMTTIRAHLETVRQARANTHRERRDLPPELAEAITRAMTGVWEQAEAIARVDIEAIRNAAQERSESLSRELEELCAAYDDQTEQLNRATASLEAVTEELNGAKEALTIAVAEQTELRRHNEALLARLDVQSEAISRAAKQLGIKDKQRAQRVRRENGKEE